MKLRSGSEGEKGFGGRDLAVFAMALLLSFGIWLIHNLSLNYRDIVSVPVVAQCNLPGHAFRASSPALVKADCRSTGYRMIRLSRKERELPVPVTFSPSDLHPKGGDLFYVTVAGLKNAASSIFGDGVTVEAFLSDTLLFRFPYQDSRVLPVEPVSDISCSPQYVRVGDIECDPDSVTVFGDPALLKTLTSVKTETISPSGVNSKYFSSVSLQKMQGLRYSVEKVDYSFDVVRYVELVSELPVEVRGVPQGKNLIVYPSTARVVMRCRFPVSAEMKQASLYVDYNDFRTSLQGQCVGRIDNLHDGVLSVSLEPEVFDCMEVTLW